MRHYKNLLNESMSLTVFEMLTKLQNFLHEKYGIKAFGAKEDNGFVMYMSRYLDDQDKPVDISEAIKKFVETDCHMENVEVHKDKYGYHITFGHNAQSAKLIEATQKEMTQADGSGISGAKTTYKCSFCGEEHEGYGNDPWPVDMEPEHRVCDNCNTEVVIPARIKQLFKKENVNEAVERSEVEKDASNIVLDSKYTWLFNVLDKNGRDLEEGIENLQDAIDMLIRDNAAFLVAFPYIDPKPNDPTVELVFADNPGPVIIYNNEEVTVPKKELERPTTERPSKPERPEQEEEQEEEAVEEAVQAEETEVINEAADLRLVIDEEPMTTITLNRKGMFVIEQNIRGPQSVILSRQDMVKVHNFVNQEVRDEYFNEAVEPIAEAVEENTLVAVDFTMTWYDMMDELEVGQEPYEAIESAMVQLEEHLADNGHFVSFDYVGQQQFDIVTNPLTREEAQEVEKVLNEFLGEWAHVKVLRQPE